MLCNGDITRTLEKPVPPCRLLRTPHIMRNNWKIKLLPNPVGSTAITSLPLKIWRTALSCSFFNEKAIPVSLSFDKTSLKHDSKSTTFFLIPNLPKSILRFSVTIWHLHVKPINQINHAAPIRCPVRGRTGFSELRGLRASVPSFPLPHPPPSPFLLSPHFPRVLNAKLLLAALLFRSASTGTLATQARPHVKPRIQLIFELARGRRFGGEQ